MTSTDISKTEPILSEDQYADIRSYDDAIATLREAGIDLVPGSEFGDGFQVMDKKEFVGVPFVIMDIKPVAADKSDYGNPFVVLRLVTKDGRKAIVTDGSWKSGVCEQAIRLVSQGRRSGITFPKGLTVSEYDYVDESGKVTPAKTYYLSDM